MAEKSQAPAEQAAADEPKRRGKIKYIGEGAYIYGVPARDLTPDEYDEYRKVILSYPTAAELYRLPEGDEPAKAKIRHREVVTNG